MKYYKNPINSQVFGYDSADAKQTALIAAAEAAGWTDVTALWPPPPPAPTPASKAVAALEAGIQVVSTGTPAINGTYSLMPGSISNVNATTTYILLNNAFPGNMSAMPWFDMSGTAHTFTDVTVFKNFATAYAGYVAAIQLYADSNGTIGAIPTLPITIA